MTEEIEEKLQGDKEDLEKTRDSNRKTWINEDLWKKVIFKVIGYMVYIVGTSLITVPFIGWSWTAFLTGCQVIILPIIWSAFDAQARNREIQDRLDNEERLEKEKKQWESKQDKMMDKISNLKDVVSNKQREVYELKSELNAKCELVEALKNANTVANGTIQELGGE